VFVSHCRGRAMRHRAWIAEAGLIWLACRERAWLRLIVPLVDAQALLGHSGVRLTSRVYTHVAVEDLRGAVEGVSEQRRGREGVG
jgi:hypothetical protein